MVDLAGRREAFESKFAHDEALRFRAVSRRNKLLGLWAARQLGKSEEEAETYAHTVIAADFDEPGDHDVLRKIVSDLNAAGIQPGEGTVRKVMEELMVRAAAEIKAGG
jgi:hypothetical protein